MRKICVIVIIALSVAACGKIGKLHPPGEQKTTYPQPYPKGASH